MCSTLKYKLYRNLICRSDRPRSSSTLNASSDIGFVSPSPCLPSLTRFSTSFFRQQVSEHGSFFYYDAVLSSDLWDSLLSITLFRMPPKSCHRRYLLALINKKFREHVDWSHTVQIAKVIQKHLVACAVWVCSCVSNHHPSWETHRLVCNVIHPRPSMPVSLSCMYLPE